MIPYMVGKLAPKPAHFTRRLMKYIPGKGYFRAVPSKNGEIFVTSPPHQIVERLTLRPWLMMGGSVEGLPDPLPRASRGGGNTAVVTCTTMPSNNFISVAVFDMSRTATLVKEK